MTRIRLFCAGILFCFGILGKGQLQAGLVIPAGFDLLESPAGLSSLSFSGFAIPSGFFGSKGGNPSNPFSGTVPLVGLPIGAMGHPAPPFMAQGTFNELGLLASHGVRDPRQGSGDFANTDTIVERKNAVDLPPAGSDTVPIEIVALSLQSVAPIEVTYTGQGSSFFDIFVTLTPGPQQPGSMTITRTGTTNGGTFTSDLPVNARLTFVGTTITDPTPQGPIDVQDRLSGGSQFTVTQDIPEPGTLWLLVTGLVGLTASSRRLRP